MSYEYDCIDDEFEDFCGVCRNTFTNEAPVNVECPHCAENEEDDEDEE
jgi:hypothetical protein